MRRCLCPLPGGLVRPPGAMRGGCSRCSPFSGLARSSSTRPGRRFQGAHYEFGPYLSPFYSPLLFGTSPHAWFGGPDVPAWWPGALPYSAGPADSLGAGRIPVHLLLLSRRLLQGVLGRSARMRRRRAAQEVSRRALVPARACRTSTATSCTSRSRSCFVLRYDVWTAMWFPAPGGSTQFGIGVGTLVLAVNVVLLGGYTLGCHSMRHLVGGLFDIMSEPAGAQDRLRRARARSTAAHMRFAWASLVLGRLHRPLHPPLLDGHLSRSADLLKCGMRHAAVQERAGASHLILQEESEDDSRQFTPVLPHCLIAPLPRCLST